MLLCDCAKMVQNSNEGKRIVKADKIMNESSSCASSNNSQEFIIFYLLLFPISRTQAKCSCTSFLHKVLLADCGQDGDCSVLQSSKPQQTAPSVMN